MPHHDSGDLLEQQYHDIKFDWIRIFEGIKANIHVLPDLYDYKDARLRSEFRKDLCSFARQLMLAGPQNFISAAKLMQDHSVELEYLAELIRWRLNLCKQKRNEWNSDNHFYWRFAMQGNEVPPEIEEQVEGFFERGEYDRAAVLFRFLTDCFDDYAEGYNYLGLISLNTGKLEEAIEHFRKAMDLGRRHFPKRMARNRYWSDHTTRSYMRGMTNLILALNRVGSHEEALEYCERLERECGDELSTASHRALIYLNTNRWREAADAALKLQNINASESLVAAFALFELGRMEDAAACFLHGALNFPRAAKILVGIRTNSPKNSDEVVDHNAGVDIRRDLGRYLCGRGRNSVRFFNRFLDHPRVNELLREMDEVGRKWGEERQTVERAAFDRMMWMRTPEFASREAKEPAGTLRSDSEF